MPARAIAEHLRGRVEFGSATAVDFFTLMAEFAEYTRPHYSGAVSSNPRSPEVLGARIFFGNRRAMTPAAGGYIAPIQDPQAMTLKNCGLKGKRQLLQVCAGAAGLCYPQVDVSPVDDFENISCACRSRATAARSVNVALAASMARRSPGARSCILPALDEVSLDAGSDGDVGSHKFGTQVAKVAQSRSTRSVSLAGSLVEHLDGLVRDGAQLPGSPGGEWYERPPKPIREDDR